MNVLSQDLYRYTGPNTSFLIRLKMILFSPGITFLFFYRHAQTSKIPFVWKIFHRIWMWHTGIQIPVQTNIGPGFRIIHFGTIVISPEAVIGKNFNLAQGTTIGYSNGKNKGYPKIGNNVSMFSNAIVVGGITVGNNVLIAPGAFVDFDVPNCSVVIGNPGRIIKCDKSPTDSYTNYPV